MKIVSVIPARWGSTRFPGKPLVNINGKTMIRRVYEQAQKSKLINEIFVATDDERIYNEVIGFGGNAVITSSKHKTGTDRINEVVKNKRCNIIVNIQGDEPYINPSTIDLTIKALLNDKLSVVSTPIKLISDYKDLKNPGVVKVVTDNNNYALYFSRSIIPYNRTNEKVKYFKHLGLYVYKKDFLLKFSKLTPTNAEKAEALEQLRILENGFKIKTVTVKSESISIDTPDDLKKLKK